MLTSFDNFWQFWQFWTMLTIFDNVDYFQQSWQVWQFSHNLNNCWQFLQILTVLTIFTIFSIFTIKFFLQSWQLTTIDDNFYNSDNCFCHFDNWKDNPGDLWHLRHWLQFWQLRTWIHDNLCYLTNNCDTGQHSQFLRCLQFKVILEGNILEIERSWERIWKNPSCDLYFGA